MKKFALKLSKMVMGVLMLFAPIMVTATSAVMTVNSVYAKEMQTTGGNERSTDSSTNSTTSGSNGKGKCVDTAILGENGQSCDDGSGSSVKGVLKLVVEIMTVGVGILSVIGISVVGVQYLTAGGDEGKTRKAKMRMFEIVIGVILYVVAYALMSWLIPDFKPFQ